MKREKRLFDLPSLSSIEGKPLSINDMEDIENGFATCSNGCSQGCGQGVGAGYDGTPDNGICTTCTE